MNNIYTSTIPYSNRKIKKIIHLADIHIRLLKRHKEYRQVFNNLIKQLKQYNREETIIVLTGDILHSKTNLSPEAVTLTTELLTRLCNIMPVIVIAGNHDSNLSNNSRLDSLSPIIEALNLDNLFYFKDTGIYKFGKNLHFAVASVFNPTVPNINSLTKSRVKIALYHGPLNNSVTDTNFIIKDSKLSINDFKDYDIVLLGDIHKPFQFLKDNIAYPGSLLQQNFGEQDLERGYLIWDVDSKSANKKIVNNDYGYVTIKLFNGKAKNVGNTIKELKNNIPKKPRIRYIIHNTDAIALKEFQNKINNNFDVQSVIVNTYQNIQEQQRGKTNYELTDNLQSVSYQNTLIKNFLKENNKNYKSVNKLNNNQINNILQLNKSFNEKLIDNNNIHSNNNWKLKSLHFSNMFSYGEDNYINFENMSNVVGLFGKNAVGKSSIIDVILFTLFDKTTRAYKGEDIINTNKEKFSTLLNFELNDTDYFIKKTGKKLYRKEKLLRVKVDIDFWRIINGVKENLNGEARKNTSKIIKQYVGEYEDFLLTSISTQNDNSNFIDMRQSDRKEFLRQILKVSIFDQLYSIASEEYKILLVKLKQFEKQDIHKQFENCKIDLDVAKEQLLTVEKEESQLKKQYKQLEQKLFKKSQQLKDIDNDILKKDFDINNIKKQLQTYNEQLNNKDNDINKQQQQFEKIKNYIDNKLTYSKQEIQRLKNNLQKYQNINKQLDDEQNKFNNLKINVQNKIDKMKKLKNLEYDPDCSYCMNNIFVIDAIKTKEILKKDSKVLYQLKNNIQLLQQKINDNTVYKEQYEKYQENDKEKKKLTDKLHQLEINLLNNKQDINDLKNYIKQLKKELQIYKNNKKNINWNKILNKEINLLTNQKDKIQTTWEETTSQKYNLKSNIKTSENQLKQLQQYLKDIQQTEKQIMLLNNYMLSVSKDGIPYMLIKKAIPVLKEQSNNILALLVDFTLDFKMDGKYINIYLINDNTNTKRSVELASGFERFIVSLAIRIAIIQISNLPKSNFLAIDEGWGSFDSDNISNISIIFDYLKTQFDFTIIISHLDSLKGSVDTSLEITQNNEGYSKINYNC